MSNYCLYLFSLYMFKALDIKKRKKKRLNVSMLDKLMKYLDKLMKCLDKWAYYISAKCLLFCLFFFHCTIRFILKDLGFGYLPRREFFLLNQELYEFYWDMRLHSEESDAYTLQIYDHLLYFFFDPSSKVDYDDIVCSKRNLFTLALRLAILFWVCDFARASKFIVGRILLYSFLLYVIYTGLLYFI